MGAWYRGHGRGPMVGGHDRGNDSGHGLGGIVG